MSFNRRKFIKQTAGITSGFALASLAGTRLLGVDFFEEKKKLKNFGLQLYTLRDDLPKDPKSVLKQVASFGYKQIESYEGKDGMFWGMGHTGFKKYMDELGMTIVSSHCNSSSDFEKKVADAAAIGMKYLIYPWEGAGKTINDYKKLADELNKNGAICKKNGIRFAFHNHDYSFRQINGEFPQDILMKNTDPELVDFEMDIYWVVAAGQDPEEWFKKYPTRFRLCHIKDRAKNAVSDNGKNSVDLGTGIIDFSKVLKTAKTNGMEYFIVEQEAYPSGTPMEAVKVDAAFLKGMKF
ncbi:MAG: sugar phosphate isomerase/epimerase [Chitinophagaceae bacterium]|nr:sugar phosphate isomerase/epimerase [Chitinophagaceae bacterium]